MFYRLFTLIFLLSFLSLTTYSLDTLRVMHYNLLYYGFYTDFCTPENNNIGQKNLYLKTILEYHKPHIFTVNEMGRGAENLDILLDHTLNVDGISYYAYASYTNSTNSTIVNAMFYDTRKFGLIGQSIPSSVLRDVNLYRLYYKSDDLELSNDTIFLTCIVAHLKAGQDVTDQQTRAIMIGNVMNYLNENENQSNILLLGDFNMQSSYEQAYQLIVSHPNTEIRLYDPVEIDGIWNNNSAVAAYHTQSTRTSGNGCFVTGGLDDRFDFILATQSIMGGSGGLKYVENSYRSPGQDGIRFNQSLVSPINFSQPQEIIDALYNLSDHLPVMVDLVISDVANYKAEIQPSVVYYNNPVRQELSIEMDSFDSDFVTISIYSIVGILHFKNINEVYMGKQKRSIDVSKYSPGVYLLNINASSGLNFSGKFVKN